MVANWLSIITSAIAGGIEYVLGGLDSLIYALAVFVILDYISGVLMAIQQKKLSSKIGFSGIAKKTMIFVLVALGSTLDQYIFGSGQTFRSLVLSPRAGARLWSNERRPGRPRRAPARRVPRTPV